MSILAENTVLAKSRDGTETEVYLNQVEALFDEYVSRLDDPETIKKSAIFAGAMRYIYEQLFRPTRKQPHNRHTIIDTADIDLLDCLWGVYCRLCYRCGIRPTLLRYALLTGIDYSTFESWKNGQYREASPLHSFTVKKWLKECESSIYDAVLDNSVGAIFAAKSAFGWRETSPEPAPVQENRTPQLTQAELMSIIDERAALDALPDLEDEGGEG